MKTVWYISKYVAPAGKGSAGSRGFQLIREFIKEGYNCTIISSDSNSLVEAPHIRSSYLKQKIDDVPFIWLKTFQYSTSNSLTRILSWLHFEWKLLLFSKKSQEKPDFLVVSSLSLLTILSGIVLKKWFGCKLIFEIRDIWPLTLTEEGGFSTNNPFVKFLSFVEKLGYEKSDHIVGTMPNLGSHVKNKLGVSKPVSCIPMGINLNELVDQPHKVCPKIHSILPEKKIIGYVGSIGISNALETLFNCAEALSENNDIHFLIVGDGDLKECYEKQFGHLTNLTFWPKVEKTDVAGILQECDFLYFATKNSEVWEYGQSLNKLIDYMLAGKPIIGSYSGFPSMINEAECGIFVPSENPESLAEAIVELCKKTDIELEEMGVKGRKWLVENRDYKKLAANYISSVLN